MTLDGLRRRVLPWIALLCRVALAGVWLYAGASKLTDLPGSIRAVNAYELFPTAVGEVIGAALPFMEVGLGLLLLAGAGTRVAAAVSTVLLIAFIVGIASAWARGLRIDCGCFGGGGALAAGEAPSYGLEIARDVLLLAAAVVLVVWPSTRFSVDHLISDEANDG